MPRSIARLVPTALSSRRRWSAEAARAILDHLDGSALSVREFADREGLDINRIYRWRAQLRSARRRPTTAPAFVEIRPKAAVFIEVVLHSGRVLRVPDGFGEETLRRLVATLEEPGTRC